MREGPWSERAQRLLARATQRRREAARHRFSDWLAQQGLPLTPALRTFWEQIDGLAYEVRGNGRVTRFALDTELIADAAGHPYIACGERDATPFLFYVDLDGRLAVAEADLGPIIIASSVARYIEADAVLDELMDLQAEWRWILVGEIAADDRRVDERVALPLIAEASDAYSQWWGDDRARLTRQVFWADDPPHDRVVGYARTDQDAQHVIAMLGDVVPANTVQMRTWPFRLDDHRVQRGVGDAGGGG